MKWKYPERAWKIDLANNVVSVMKPIMFTGAAIAFTLAGEH